MDLKFTNTLARTNSVSDPWQHTALESHKNTSCSPPETKDRSEEGTREGGKEKNRLRLHCKVTLSFIEVAKEVESFLQLDRMKENHEPVAQD